MRLIYVHLFRLNTLLAKISWRCISLDDLDFLRSCSQPPQNAYCAISCSHLYLHVKCATALKTGRTSSLYKTVMAWFQCGGGMLHLCSLAFSGLFCKVANYLNHLHNDQPLFLKVRTACFHPGRFLYGCFEFSLILFVRSGCNAKRFWGKMVPTGFESLKGSLTVNGMMRDEWPTFTKQGFPVMVRKTLSMWQRQLMNTKCDSPQI